MDEPDLDAINATRIAGVDEAGRGPLAGPVVAAAVILDPARPISGLADSKTLTPARRETLALQIQAQALAWALGTAGVEEIDRLNILQATLLAMCRAIEALPVYPELVLVDGNQSPVLHCTVRTVVRGDATVPAISAASILAKVARDRTMAELDVIYPGYGFARHKGYPTVEHIQALGHLGATPEHRLSFAPVRKIMR